ncbi:hypothetical protein AQJ64_03255 [Streptomyces griseoruber]|uniref:Uncharacterized protein n=1 Tax=Streptomyces griseoruber TaxID=1943 RepID=A0A101T9C2_9ACTN|nr:hypothetical protein AQJ64_03255 [Streptomyces griseoruber]
MTYRRRAPYSFDGKPQPWTGSSQQRLAWPSMRWAAARSSGRSSAGCTVERLLTMPSRACGTAARTAWTARPWPRSRWYEARTAAVRSVRPGAMVPSR